METRGKFKNIFWLIYLVLSVGFIAWDISYTYNDLTLEYKLFSLSVSILFLAGLIGFIFQLRIGYKLIWRVLFVLIALSFGFMLALSFFTPLSSWLPNAKELITLMALSIPNHYAIFCYVYKSPSVWKN